METVRISKQKGYGLPIGIGFIDGNYNNAAKYSKTHIKDTAPLMIPRGIAMRDIDYGPAVERFGEISMPIGITNKHEDYNNQNIYTPQHAPSALGMSIMSNRRMGYGKETGTYERGQFPVIGSANVGQDLRLRRKPILVKKNAPINKSNMESGIGFTNHIRRLRRIFNVHEFDNTRPSINENKSYLFNGQPQYNEIYQNPMNNNRRPRYRVGIY